MIGPSIRALEVWSLGFLVPSSTLSMLNNVKKADIFLRGLPANTWPSSDILNPVSVLG